jgi:cellulose synthase/poly-beta-1,6-N-acetylglucosamine synthase-like glycosyltransferase
MALVFIILFWLCSGVVVYTYAIYPLLVWCLSRFVGSQPIAPQIDSPDAPFVSMIIVAHNEEAVMEQRLCNALEVAYPRERFEIVVASDGSSDATTDIVRRYAHHGVRLIEFIERRGKAGVLNLAIAQVQGEIVLLSDGNTELDSAAALNLVRWFKNPSVGVVCGRLMLTDPSTGQNAESLYWRYETILKRCESRLGGLLGANGAIYAIRRSCFEPISENSLVDDFLIPLLARLRSGCSVLYDAEAVAHERSAPDMLAEFRRRTRIGAGNFQNIEILLPLVNPRRGFIAFSFFSHKLLRWFCPFFLIGLLGTSLALSNRPFYRVVLIGQLFLYLFAAIVGIIPGQIRIPKILRLPTMFLYMNLALLNGFCRWLYSSPQGTWEPTPRSPTARRGPVIER